MLLIYLYKNALTGRFVADLFKKAALLYWGVINIEIGSQK